MINVRTSAMAIDCPHSLISRMTISFFISFRLESRQEGLLRDLHFPELLHSFLSFFLFFPELSLTRDVPAVTLSSHIFPERLHGFPRDDFSADRRLDAHLEKLSRDQFPQFFAKRSA